MNHKKALLLRQQGFPCDKKARAPYFMAYRSIFPL
jgi:hypothetical protein